jgi:aspartyl-tRNA(Asn)/glutamyl-tRNA(Gln) amidotransferase subunit C
MLTTEEVAHIAELARLQLTVSEIEKFREQLSTVIDYVDRIGELELTKVIPTYSVLTMPSALRSDDVHDSLTREELLRNAAKTEAGLYQVPAILDDG